MSWLHAWFGLDWPTNIVQLLGGCLLLLPITFVLLSARRSAAKLLESDHFRLTFLASLLIFLVIFNHKAESPMFILPVTGVAIWYAAFPQSCLRNLIVALVLVFTSLCSTDVVPRHWRVTITTPLVIKAVPCILAWLVMQGELMRLSFRTSSRFTAEVT